MTFYWFDFLYQIFGIALMVAIAFIFWNVFKYAKNDKEGVIGRS